MIFELESIHLLGVDKHTLMNQGGNSDLSPLCSRASFQYDAQGVWIEEQAQSYSSCQGRRERSAFVETHVSTVSLCPPCHPWQDQKTFQNPRTVNSACPQGLCTRLASATGQPIRDPRQTHHAWFRWLRKGRLLLGSSHESVTRPPPYQPSLGGSLSHAKEPQEKAGWQGGAGRWLPAVFVQRRWVSANCGPIARSRIACRDTRKGNVMPAPLESGDLAEAGSRLLTGQGRFPPQCGISSLPRTAPLKQRRLQTDWGRGLEHRRAAGEAADRPPDLMGADHPTREPPRCVSQSHAVGTRQRLEKQSKFRLGFSCRCLSTAACG